jgi:hypothetical protein
MNSAQTTSNQGFHNMAEQGLSYTPNSATSQTRLLASIVNQIQQHTGHVQELTNRVRMFADELFGAPPSSGSTVLAPNSGPKQVYPIIDQLQESLNEHTSALSELESQLTRMSNL